jgi:hypothetical protein
MSKCHREQSKRYLIGVLNGAEESAFDTWTRVPSASNGSKRRPEGRAIGRWRRSCSHRPLQLRRT